MNIMISDATLSHGGAERVISILSNHLVQLGHEVELLLYYDMPIWYELDDKVKITIDEKIIGKRNAVKHCMFRRKYIKEKKPDIVLSFLAPFNMLMIVTMLGMKIPLVVADRNDPKRVPTNVIIRKCRDFLYRFADGVVLQNTDNQQYFSKVVQSKSTIIFNPIDLGDNRGIALKSKKEKKIVSVGRIISQKNPKLLLEAFREIADDFPEYSLINYGDGDMMSEMKELSEKYGLSGRVFYPGSSQSVINEIKDAELYAMTSEYEGMPNALLEAMCVGLPVISTRVSGATDIIINNENGILIDIGNKEQLVVAMRRMLLDKEFSQDCAKRAVQLAEKLDTDKIIHQWLNYFEEVLKI